MSDGRNCKESLLHRQARRQSFLCCCCAPTLRPLPLSDFTLVRRQNVLALFQRFAERALAQGVPPKGLEQDFAARLQISPSMWSQIKSARPIGNKLARQIEAACDQPNGWLDEAHEDAPPTEEEKAFLVYSVQHYMRVAANHRKSARMAAD